MSAKRRRTDGGARSAGRSYAYPGYNVERRANPASGFMRQYHPRSAATLAAYGRSRSAATPEQLALRNAHRVYGRGKYSVGKNWRKFAQSIGLAGAGRRIVGAGAGLAAGLMGGGAYTTNSLIDTDMAEVPRVISAADETGAVTVTRREFIKDIYVVNQQFQNEMFALNPGIDSTFPWLAQIAQNYEEYDLEQCVFTFRSTVTDIGTTSSGQVGTVIMATNYNAAAAMFTDKNEMMEYDGAVSAKATENIMHGVECDDAKRSGADAHYVRAMGVPSGQDAKTYDHGLFQLAVAGCPVPIGQSVGELWVSYTVTLRKPRFFTARGFGISQDIFVSGDGTETGTAWMGTAAGLLTGQQNSIGCALDLSVANAVTVRFPDAVAGTFEVLFWSEGLTFAAAGQIPTTAPSSTGNVAPINDMYAAAASGDAPNYYSPTSYAGAGGQRVALTIHVRVAPRTGTANTVTFLLPTSTGGPSQSYLVVREYNTGFSSRSQAIGPAAARSDAPVLVNASGAVVVPA